MNIILILIRSQPFWSCSKEQQLSGVFIAPIWLLYLLLCRREQWSRLCRFFFACALQVASLCVLVQRGANRKKQQRIYPLEAVRR